MQKFFSDSKETIITHCLSCEAKDLFLQKDFPRKIAIFIVILGIITVPWTLGISLIVVAAIDFVIYQFTPWMLVCYRCKAEYRGYHNPARHWKEFDRHVDELYKYK